MDVSIIDDEAIEGRKLPHQLLLELLEAVNSVPELKSLQVWIFRGTIEADHERIAEVWNDKCSRFGRGHLGESGAKSILAYKHQIERARARTIAAQQLDDQFDNFRDDE